MGDVTNETPENHPSIPPTGPVSGSAPVETPAPGQHGFDGTFSSNAADAQPVGADAAPVEPAPVYDPNAQAYAPSAPPYAQNYNADGYPLSAYPGAVPATPKKPMSKGLLFGIIGGAAALVLLGAAVIVVPIVVRGAAPTASEAVEGYLTALSEGDAETALTFIETYDREGLLTDEVLAASLELAPLSDIVVEESEGASEYDETVSATFSLGGETIERQFKAYNSAQDGWVISDGLINASLTSFEGLGVTVNGATADDDSISVFPGAYQLALEHEEFAIDADSDIFTFATNDDTERLWDIYPMLTDEGASTFRSLVRAAIEECVAMKTLSTPCGMDITGIDLSGAEPVDGSVVRTLASDGESVMDSMEPEVDYSTPTRVSTYDTPSVDMTLKGTSGGTTSEYEVWFGGYMDTPSVDFAEETPVVTWR